MSNLKNAQFKLFYKIPAFVLMVIKLRRFETSYLNVVWLPQTEYVTWLSDHCVSCGSMRFIFDV